MIPSLLVFLYLCLVLYIGIFAFRNQRAESSAEGFFLAGRSLGAFVFIIALFGTHMTAFAILGSSGHAYRNGIVTYGLMASSSALIVPLCLFFVGTRIWTLGKRYGFMTPVQFLRDRWDCGHIGTVIFVLQAALLVPYIIIGVIGGGTALRAISGGLIPYPVGGAVVALVVMCYVFFGGMRGTAWVNAFQTVLFLSFGVISVIVIGRGLGGFQSAAERILSNPDLAWLLSRERVSPEYFFSYLFMPLSAIAFPHITIFCLTAKRRQQFKGTVILYPICILAIWLPCVYLGVLANGVEQIPSGTRDDVLLLLLRQYAPEWLAGILGAGIMAAVMASDSQILALSTMFTEDIFAYYGHRERFGERAQVFTGRLFVILVTTVAYLFALRAPASIFELASQYAFAGFAALSTLFVAALYWRRSTKWGALAATIWVGLSSAGTAGFQSIVTQPGPVLSIGGVDVISRSPAGMLVLGYLPVVPMTLIAALLMVIVSMMTAPPKPETLSRYFPATRPTRTLRTTAARTGHPPRM